jgi:hypothetical protein
LGEQARGSYSCGSRHLLHTFGVLVSVTLIFLALDQCREGVGVRPLLATTSRTSEIYSGAVRGVLRAETMSGMLRLEGSGSWRSSGFSLRSCSSFLESCSAGLLYWTEIGGGRSIVAGGLLPLLAGILGNQIDRLVLGYVRDYSPRQLPHQIFNTATSSCSL